MRMNILEMTIADYEEVAALWRKTEGIGLHVDVDSKEGITKYLLRNPSLSFVARENGKIIGAVLCGQDGRRGYLNHLAVDSAWRGRGVGKALAAHCLGGLKKAGISRCNIHVFADNQHGHSFWQHLGWSERNDLKVMYCRLT